MKLIIGGYAQGKLGYVLRQINPEGWTILDGNSLESPLSDMEHEGHRIVFNHFHSWVKGCMEKGGCPEVEMREYLEKCADCIVISDEIGNGIVPVDAFERAYRERTGRLLVELAAEAEEVVRVLCGIGQKIK